MPHISGFSKIRNFTFPETIYNGVMRRVAGIVLLGMALCVTLPLMGQRRSAPEFHGTPASVTSPGLNGQPRGIPASVTDPTFGFGASVHFGGQSGAFCCRRGHFRNRFPAYAVPYYGAYYPYIYDSSMYVDQQPQQQQAPPPQVIVIKDERSSSSESRYGEHEFDERDRKAEAAPKPAAPASVAPPAKEEPPVMTTLVYRDGHKAEVLNYAIVGSNLVDLSKGSVLKKIPLASLDLEATRRENEENGIDFHLP